MNADDGHYFQWWLTGFITGAGAAVLIGGMVVLYLWP